MRIFMTGGTGFVGRYLTGKLSESGHEVTVLTRSAGKIKEISGGVAYIEGDPKESGGWQEKVAEHEVLINLAGATIFNVWTPAVRQEILDSRILTTRNLVDALARSSGKGISLISTSAVGYYGARMDDQILDETSPQGDDFLTEVSLQWEAEANRAEELGVRVVLARFGIVLGRGGGALSTMLPGFKYCLASPLGSGKQWFSWIHLEDLARIMLFLLVNTQISGPVNCTAPHPVRNKEMTAIMGRVLHRPLFMPAIPGLLLKLVLGELGNVLLKGQRVIPKKLLEEGFQFQYPILLDALEDLLR